jgi:hypothetical protein
MKVGDTVSCHKISRQVDECGIRVVHTLEANPGARSPPGKSDTLVLHNGMPLEIF